MSVETVRLTLRLDRTLVESLRSKSAETGRSVTSMISEAIRNSLGEDADDLEAFEERRAEMPLTYEEFLRRLRLDHVI